MISEIIKKIGSFIIIVVFLLFLGGCWYLMDDEPHIVSSAEYTKVENRLIRESREKRAQYLKDHPELDKQQRALIESGSLGLGLTKEQVNLIMGKDAIGRDIISQAKIGPTNRYEADEVYLFNYKATRRYLYFKDNILVKIEDTIETIFGETKNRSE